MNLILSFASEKQNTPDGIKKSLPPAEYSLPACRQAGTKGRIPTIPPLLKGVPEGRGVYEREKTLAAFSETPSKMMIKPLL